MRLQVSSHGKRSPFRFCVFGGLRCSDHLHLRYRNDEASAPLSIFRLLLQNLVSEVPCQQQQIVRHLFKQLLRRVNAEVCTWRVVALLNSAAVYDEVERLSANVEIV